MSLRRKLENLFNNIKKIETTVGERWILDNRCSVCFIGESEEGLIFMDKEAFSKSTNEICYIPENNFELYYQEVDQLLNEYIDKKITVDELYQKLNETNNSYSYKDILNICNSQDEVANEVFNSLTWQKPETIIEKMYINRELVNYKGYLVLTKGLPLDEYLYEMYKKDWCANRGVQAENIDEESGFFRECYVSFEEFMDNEYCDDEYIQYLIQSNQKASNNKVHELNNGYYIFDDEIIVDTNNSIIDAYLWATDCLVEKLVAVSNLDENNMENINFYALYNVETDTITLQSTFDYLNEICDKVYLDYTLPLSLEEQELLKIELENYCNSQESMSCRALYEEIKNEEIRTTLDYRLNEYENRRVFSQETRSYQKQEMELSY